MVNLSKFLFLPWIKSIITLKAAHLQESLLASIIQKQNEEANNNFRLNTCLYARCHNLGSPLWQRLPL